MTAPLGLCNIRDIGGMPTEDGRTTRHGVLYRSEAPLAGDPVPDGLLVWPPRTVLDLRSARERAHSAHPLAVDGTVVAPVAIVEDEKDSGAAGKMPSENAAAHHYFSKLYLHWVLQTPERLAMAVTTTLRADTPVLVHCAAGRDRTGVVTALLLLAVGVRRDVVEADYARTDDNMAGIVERLIRDGRRIRNEDDLVVLRTPRAIVAALDVVEAHPAGTAGWLRDHGVTPGDLHRWEELLLGDRATHAAAAAGC